MQYGNSLDSGESNCLITRLLINPTSAILDTMLYLCERGHVEVGMVFQLLEDLTDMSTIKDCKYVFGYIESKQDVLGKQELFGRGKLVMLRTCNQLLRRLSKEHFRNPALTTTNPTKWQKFASNYMFNHENVTGYLSPYRCTRYHVEQWQNGPPPQGMKETFNHAHANVRNVIERSFGVLKMKFRILLNMPKFREDKQARSIVACTALHNSIRESRIADREFDACDADENYNPMPSSSTSAWPEDEPLVEDINMNAFRDELANALFHGM